jgi:hypothetical protein
MKKNPNHDLLVAGARDFLKASAAIAKFGDDVYDTGVRVLKNRAAELKKATGIPVNADKIREAPKEGYIVSGHDGTEATIGPTVPLPNWNYLYLYVWWRTSDEHPGQELCSAVASVGCNTVGTAEALYQALRDRSKGAVKRDVSRYEVYTEKFLKPEEFVSLEFHFEALIEQWILYGKSLGGLKQYLKF